MSKVEKLMKKITHLQYEASKIREENSQLSTNKMVVNLHERMKNVEHLVRLIVEDLGKMPY